MKVVDLHYDFDSRARTQSKHASTQLEIGPLTKTLNIRS